MASDYKQICLENIRRRGEEFDDIGRLISEQLYSDKSHFIYELLQNAEDALGRRFKLNPSDRSFRKVRFILFHDRLEFRHFGALFNEEDVKGISDVLKGTKKEDIIQIGKFGIGFKSVYSFTSSPEIHSGDEHFIIRRYIRPEAQLSIPSIEINETVFVFPFNHQEFSEKDAFELIFNKLQGLGPRVLLFLRWIDEIEWLVEPNEVKGQYIKEAVKLESYNDVRKITVIGNGSDQDENWLVFERYVKIPDSVNDLNNSIPVEIGFLLEYNEKDKNERIIKVKNSPLVVFFPTEKETRFGFLIQGPYKTTPGRDNILTDNIWNKLLVQETAKLLTFTVLPYLKQMDLLSVSLLEALPIKKDDFPWYSTFLPIFVAIRDAFMTEDLIPAYDGTFVSARNGKLASAEWLRKLLQEKQLLQLYKTENSLKWVSGDITERAKNDLWKYLREELKVEEITPDSFARKVDIIFFEHQTDEWFIEFYKQLAGQKSLWKKSDYSFTDNSGPLRAEQFIRLQNDSHVLPFDNKNRPSAYLPGNSTSSFPTVKKSIANDEEALNFLKMLDFKEPDALAEILEFVLPKYREGGINVSKDENIVDVQNILNVLISAASDKKKTLIDELRQHYLLSIKTGDGKTYWCIPQFAYLSSIHTNSQELEHYFEGNPAGYILTDHYNDFAKEHLVKLGCSEKVRVTCRTPQSDGTVLVHDSHGDHQRGLNGFDPDAEIDGLDYAINFITVQKARIIWDLLKKNYKAIFGTLEISGRQDFSGSEKENRFSKMGQLAHEKAWIPDKEGQFRRSSDIMFSQLSDKLDGESLEAKSMASILGLKGDDFAILAEKAGIQAEDIEFIKQYPEEIRRLRKEIAARIRKPIFPTSTGANPERQLERFAEQFADSCEKNYEPRVRLVRITEATQYTRTWLRNKYANDDGQMVCQICKEEMPFRKHDGEFYFEAVEALSRKYFANEHEAQFLALCPLCSAMYKEFVKRNERAMKDLHEALKNSEEPLVQLFLGDKETSIQFVETHWHYMRTILRERS